MTIEEAIETPIGRSKVGQNLAKEMNEIMEAETIPYLYSIFQKNDPPTEAGEYSEFFMRSKPPRVCAAESLEHKSFEVACYTTIKIPSEKDKIKSLFGEYGRNRALNSLTRNFFSTCCITLAHAGYIDCKPEFKKQEGEFKESLEYFKEFLDNVKNKYGNIYSNLEITPVEVTACDDLGGTCGRCDGSGIDETLADLVCCSCNGRGIRSMKLGFVAYFNASLWVKCKEPGLKCTTIELTERQKAGLKTGVPQGWL